MNKDFKKNFIIIILLSSIFLLNSCSLFHKHKYKEEIISPTCTELGYTKYTCKCGDTYKENEVSPTGHTLGEWTILKEATEEEEGLKEKQCNNCEYKETETIAMLNHNHSYKEEIISPTCIESGYTKYTCKCGDTYKENEVSPIGHTLGEWTIVKEATDEEEGLKERQCNNCEYKETETYEYSINYLRFSLDESLQTYMVIGLKDENKDIDKIKIPKTYNGKNVTSIGERAFYNCTNLKSLTIPNSVTSIGSYAFYHCTNLKSITIPNSVTSIGSYAFTGCDSLIYNIYNNVRYLGNQDNLYLVLVETVIGDITNHNINSSTKVIMKSAFSSHDLTNIYYEGTIESWCNISFSDNDSNPMYYAEHFYIKNENSNWNEVTEIEIPNTITKIGDYQFYGFENVTSITIPSSVKSIGQYVFYDCTAEIYWDNPTIKEIGSYAFAYYNGASITIPNSVTNIGEKVFYKCSSLRSITIPFVGAALNGTTNTHFGYIFGASSSGNNETNVPKSLYKVIITGGTSIGKSAFSNCRNLTNITIPEEVTSIGQDAFWGCISLTSMTIPSSVTSIGNSAFSSCGSLTNVYYGGTIENWCNISFGSTNSNPMYYADHFYMKNEEGNWTEVKEIEIPNTITEIGNYQLYGFKNLTSITIPNSVISIGSSAFEGCSGLISITIPFVGATLNGTTNTHFGYIFGASSSENNKSVVPKSLKEVIISGGTSIEFFAFRNCNSLTSITIPNSVTSISSCAFVNCSLMDICYEGTIEDWCNILFDTSTIIFDTYADYLYLKNEEDNWYKATEIVIPETITKIGRCQFYGFRNITSITIPFVGATLNGTTNTDFGYIFGDNDCVPSSLNEVIITGGTSIGKEAFSGCNSLTSITIPSSVTSIGKGAFSGCDNLKKVYYEGTIEDWCNILFDNSNPMKYANRFYMRNVQGNWYEVTEIVIPNTITEIGNYQFYGFENIISITIPSNVTSIGSFAFSECSRLKKIAISEGVTTIGTSAFFNCSSLTSITIPSSVISIEEKAFSSCTAQIMWDNPTIKELCSKAFYNYQGKIITIPSSVMSIGQYVFYDCTAEIYWDNPTIKEIGSYAFAYYKGTSITIPNSVTSIGDDAFYKCSNLISINILGSVTSIGWNTFEKCTKLTSITIPSSVTSIGKEAFYNCNNLTNVYYDGTIESWCNISFIHNNSNPMYYAEHFYMKNEEGNWYEVTEIEIPNTITKIGDYQFYGFENVKSIIIPNSVTSIGSLAVYNCSSLTYNIYDNAKYLGNEENPYVILVKSNNQNITSCNINEKTKTIMDYAFSNCSDLGSVTIPSSVTSIGSYAFENCSSLTSITLPFIGQTVNETSNTHFGYIFGASSYSTNSRCVPSSLKEVNITGGTKVDSNAFRDCSSLTSITIPEEVTSIGQYAFWGCISLTSMTIPSSVTSIGEYAFYYCNSLTNVYYEGTIESWCDISISAYYIQLMGSAEHFYMKNEEGNWYEIVEIIIPNTITKIGDCQFNGFENVTSIIIPSSVTSIGTSAFKNCNNLTNVYYEGTIEDWCNISFSSLDSNPMYYAEHFYMKNEEGNWYEATEIVIPNTITKIGDYQFYGFENITSITIPNYVINIGSHAFYYCNSLTNVYYDGTIESWCNISFIHNNSNPMYYAEHFYMKNEESNWYEVTEIEIPNTIIKIGDYQFYGFENVKSIIIPNSVTSIGSSAVYNCSSLTYNIYDNAKYLGNEENPYVILVKSNNQNITSCNINEKTKTIMDYAFSNCSDLGSVTIPSSVTKIGSYAFEDCSRLTSIVIPESVTKIGSYAFEDCTSLKNVYYEGTIESWCDISISAYYAQPMDLAEHFYMKNEEGNWYEVIEIEIPNTITKIRDYQFYGFENVTSITIPSSVTSIGQYAFEYCTAEIIWDNPTITKIGDFAFYNYKGENITIPSSVTSIGQYAFTGCSNLTNVYYEETIESWCNISFGHNDSNPMYYAKHFYIKNEDSNWYEVTEIEIPNTITEIGNYQFYGFKNLISIIIPSSVTSIGSYAFEDCTSLTNVYYEVSKEEWNKISINSGNSNLINTTICFNYK